VNGCGKSVIVEELGNRKKPPNDILKVRPSQGKGEKKQVTKKKGGKRVKEHTSPRSPTSETGIKTLIQSEKRKETIQQKERKRRKH